MMNSSMRQPLVAHNSTRHLDIVNIKDFLGSPPDVMVDTQAARRWIHIAVWLCLHTTKRLF